MNDDTLLIRKNAKQKTLSKAFFVHVKEEIIGQSYELSLVFCSQSVSKKLNQKFRKKNKPTNILSFPLTKTSGEIFIDQKTAQTDAKKFELDTLSFVGFLYIHGLLHLKGYEHSSTMKRLELKYFKQFFPNKRILYV